MCADATINQWHEFHQTSSSTLALDWFTENRCFLLSVKHTQRIDGTTRTPSIERLRNAVWSNQRNSQMTGDILNLKCSALILLRHISHSLCCFDSRAAEHKQKIRIWSDGALLSSLSSKQLNTLKAPRGSKAKQFKVMKVWCTNTPCVEILLTNDQHNSRWASSGRYESFVVYIKIWHVKGSAGELLQLITTFNHQWKYVYNFCTDHH